MSCWRASVPITIASARERVARTFVHKRAGSRIFKLPSSATNATAPITVNVRIMLFLWKSHRARRGVLAPRSAAGYNPPAANDIWDESDYLLQKNRDFVREPTVEEEATMLDDVADDSALVKRILSGNTTAKEKGFRELWKRFTKLAAEVEATWRSSIEKEDCRQEAFATICRKLPEFTRGMPLKPWMTQIYKHKLRDAVDHAGRQKRDERKKRNSTKLLSRTPTESSSIGTKVGRKEDAQILNTKIAELPPPHGEILKLHLAGLNYSEIAQQLKITEGAARVRVTRARSELRKQMGSGSNLNFRK